MILYRKLGQLLKERGMSWIDLRGAGLAANTPFKFSTDKGLNTDSIDKVCAFLDVQPGDIMEYISKEEYESQNAEKIDLEKQIAELQARLKELNK